MDKDRRQKSITLSDEIKFARQMGIRAFTLEIIAMIENLQIDTSEEHELKAILKRKGINLKDFDTRKEC